VPAARKGKATGKYRSKFEAKTAPPLEAAGATYEEVQLPYQLARVYTPDWELPNGILIEIKGYFPAPDRAKMRAVQAAHPWRDIRIVFQNAAVKLTKKSKTTYGEWATKHGFIWAQGAVPASWLQ
jgi:hypothetical protein